MHLSEDSYREVLASNGNGRQASRLVHFVMAGAAGFEPAVPGLGGRCIIQAMLHARSREHDLLKKCAPKKTSFPILLSDAIKRRKHLE